MQDEELQELLEKNLEISEESLRLLKSMKRDMWYRRVFTVIKWLAILGVLAWGYTQVQPYLEQLIGLTQIIQSLPENIPQIPGF